MISELNYDLGFGSTWILYEYLTMHTRFAHALVLAHTTISCILANSTTS